MTDQPWPDAERRKERQVQLQTIINSLADSDERMTRLEMSLLANTRATNEIAANTAGIVEFTNDLVRGARLLCRLAKAADWLIEKFMQVWKPVVLMSGLTYFLIYRSLPEWVLKLAKVLLG